MFKIRELRKLRFLVVIAIAVCFILYNFYYQVKTTVGFKNRIKKIESICKYEEKVSDFGEDKGQNEKDFEYKNKTVIKTENKTLPISKISMSKPVELLSNFSEMAELIGSYDLPVTINSGYLLENKTLCTSEGNLLILILVHTAPAYFDKRSVLRETWTNTKYLAGFGPVRLLFSIGRTDAITQRKIQNEFEVYGDILQADFIDSYKNLTNKGVAEYRWISEYCKNAKYILKVDDDVFVNMFNVFRYMLPYVHGKHKTVICHWMLSSTVLRHRKSKWSLDNSLFAGKKIYPPYCRGYFALFTNDLTPLLYEAAKSTPFFWIDDVYLYGLLFKRIPGLTVNGLNRNVRSTHSEILKGCLNNGPSSRPQYCDHLIAIGNRKGHEIRAYWNQVVNELTNTTLSYFIA